MAEKFTLRVNGSAHTIEADPDMPLLYALRDDLGLSNPHFGCGLSQCGACTVIVDGVATRSCVTPVEHAAGHDIGTTLRARTASQFVRSQGEPVWLLLDDARTHFFNKRSGQSLRVAA